MTHQTATPITHRTLPIQARNAHGLARDAHEGDLDVAPAYQRGSVWTNDQRIALIRSMCAGVPVSVITINDRHAARRFTDADTADHRDVLIDGRQRTETLRDWFFGDLAVPASWFPAENVENTIATDDGPYVRHQDLTDDLRRVQRTTWTIPAVTVALPTVEEEAALYVLVERTGTPQTAADVAHAEAVADGSAAR